MSDTNLARPRGRPRRFDPEVGVAIAQKLFHERGYDAVSVADLTQALGINPPSFYAAFGSKAALFARTLCRYTSTEGLPIAEILREGAPLAPALLQLLEEAARRYGGGSGASGCLTIEGTHCNDREARQAARRLADGFVAALRDFIAATRPELAERLADYMATVLAGLSAMARQGHDRERLLASARLAGEAIVQALR